MYAGKTGVAMILAWGKVVGRRGNGIRADADISGTGKWPPPPDQPPNQWMASGPSTA